jgi:hypothetical protein
MMTSITYRALMLRFPFYQKSTTAPAATPALVARMAGAEIALKIAGESGSDACCLGKCWGVSDARRSFLAKEPLGAKLTVPLTTTLAPLQDQIHKSWKEGWL